MRITHAAADRAVALLTVLLVISVALNIGLAYRVREFASLQAAQLAQLEAQRLKPGTAVPPLTARRADRIDQTLETIAYAGSGRPTVLYVLSPTCGWCARNHHSIQTLVAAKGREYRFIGVSLIEQGAAEYAALHGFGVPLYTGLSEDARHAYRMGATPQTIVVSPEGVVVATWNGAYVGKRKEQVEQFFGVRLTEIGSEERT